MGGEEGKTSISSIARVDLKIALAKGAICQANDCREFRSGGKGIQPKEDLMPGGTRGCQFDMPFIRWWGERGLVHHKNAIRRQVRHGLGKVYQGCDVADGVCIGLP
jgi:hypothetical protein